MARNLALAALSVAVSPLVLWSVGSLGARVPPLVPVDDLLSSPWALVATFLVLDLWSYWAHRWAHVVPLMWRLHAVHHLDEHLDVTSAFRFHMADVALGSLLRVVPALLVGIGPVELLAFETALVASAAFHHSNIALPAALERGLAYLITTPAMHRLHHHARRSDTDSNYTSILSIWDTLFGSRNSGGWTRAMPIGVEGEAERTLAQLLAYPTKTERSANSKVR